MGTKSKIESEEKTVPTFDEPEWNDYLISQLAEDEKDENGNPKVPGLRRLVKKFIGNIIENCSNLVADAYSENGFRAVCSNKIIVSMHSDGSHLTYSDVADCWERNCDPEYARFLVATAATRAEGRCLRKILGLKKIAAEETTILPVGEVVSIEPNNKDDFISGTQLTIINRLCQRNDINVVKFLEAEGVTNDIKTIENKTAVNLIKKLDVWQRNPDKIPTQVRGFVGEVSFKGDKK